MKIRHFARWIIGLGGLVLHAQTPEPDPGPQPTVTAAMGDPGGKFFGRAPDPAKVRRYFVAAEPEQWDYAPSGKNEMCGTALPPPLLVKPRVGKLRYIAYADGSFAARLLQDPKLGILGPVLRGVVGEYLVVTFLNRTDQPLSMHPHGVHYDKDSEGAYYRPGPGLGAAVAPGATFTYVWHLDERSGPGPDEPSSKGWLYHSHVRGDEDANHGLVGCIVVTDPARARPDGTPRDVDREFATLFMTFDESGLGEAEREAAEYASLPGGNAAFVKSFAEVQELMETGSRYAINGRTFGHLRGLDMNEGERVRWYVFGLGSERDFHTAHWHGSRVLEEGRRRTDVVELLPATMKVADMIADNPGTWMLHCHVAEHMREGMFTAFTVHARDTVGVSRAPGDAFLGRPGSGASMRIDRAERSPANPAGQAPTRVLIEGAVTVFEGFSILHEPIRVQVGDFAAEFKPGANGVAHHRGATWRVKNGGDLGVIYGGLMEFELEIAAADFGTGETLSLEIGAARHRAQLTFAPHSRQP